MSDFDDIFKSSLHDHEVDVPDDMWSRIQDAQDPEDVEKGFWFNYRYMLGLFLLFFLSITAYTFYNLSSNSVEIESKEVGDELIASAEINDFRSLLKPSSEITLDSELNIITENSKTSDLKVSKSHVNKTTYSTRKSYSKIIDLLELNENKESAAKIETKESGVAGIQIINRDLNLVDKLNRSPLQFELKESPFLEVNYIQPDYDNKCPKFGKSRTGFFSVEAYHSSDFNLKSLASKSDEFAAYAAVRAQTERSRYSFSDGVKLKWHNNSGLSFGVGVERNQINERFTYKDEDARETRTLITFDTLFMPDGTFIPSTDTTRIELGGIKMNDISNNYTSIDLPINLSYQIELNRWAVAINAGVHINLLFTQKGRILGIDNQPAWISNGSINELEAYQAKSGLKFDGSISVIYHLTDQIDLMVEPYFKYNNNSFTLEKYQLDQYYNTVGLRTGARYNFGF